MAPLGISIYKIIIVKNVAIEKSKSFLIEELIKYVSQAIVLKTILNKPTGNLMLISLDIKKYFSEKISPFDTFIQIIEGQAEISINNELLTLNSKKSIIIPAHSKNSIRLHKRFKMISTIIKSGYK